MDPAIPADPRSLWLNSPDALLQVLCCVAFCGHDARGFSSLTRAFRGDEVLWGCIKDRRGLQEETALMACACLGDMDRVRWLLEQGADVSAKQDCGKSSLMWACESGHLSVVLELLEQGADVDGADESGKTSLMEACKSGHLSVVLELLEQGANVSATQDSGKDSLMWACQKGHLDFVRELLGRGANVNAAQTDDGTTSLMWASFVDNEEVVLELLRRGANVNAAQTDDGMTSLMWACTHGHFLGGVVRELLAHGANVDDQSIEGTTSLMWACMYGNLEIATLLLAHRANKATLDFQGNTAYDFVDDPTSASYTELRALVMPPAAAQPAEGAPAAEE